MRPLRIVRADSPVRVNDGWNAFVSEIKSLLPANATVRDLAQAQQALFHRDGAKWDRFWDTKDDGTYKGNYSKDSEDRSWFMPGSVNRGTYAQLRNAIFEYQRSMTTAYRVD